MRGRVHPRPPGEGAGLLGSAAASLGRTREQEEEVEGEEKKKHLPAGSSFEVEMKLGFSCLLSLDSLRKKNGEKKRW